MLSSKRSRSDLFAAAIAVSLILSFGTPGFARSVEMGSSLSQARSPYELILCGKSASFDLKVTRKTITMIEVASGHEGNAFHKDESFDFKEEGNHKVYIAPTGQASLGATTSIRFWLPNGREATIHARVVADLPVEDNVLLYHQSERQKLGLMDKPNPCDPRPERATDRLIARATERHAHGPVARAVPVVEGVTKSGHALDVSILLAEWDGDDMVVDFEANNPDFQPSRLTAIEVLDEAGRKLDMKLLSSHARQEGDASELATITSYQGMTGSILLPGAVSREVGSMEIRFHGVKGSSPYFTAVKVVRFRPVTEEETEREERAKQVAVSARLLGGGYWMGIGDDTVVVSGIEGATMTGLGVRLSKGMRHNFAFDGELVGARSGEVQFSNVTWSGMTGDVTRQASFARLQGAGVIRFGLDYVTSMRLGVGLQVTKVTSTMTAGGVSVDGPGDGFEVDGFFATGMGFDTRLGEHWLLGAGMTFAGGLKTELRSLEIGLHAGYRWEPRR